MALRGSDRLSNSVQVLESPKRDKLRFSTITFFHDGDEASSKPLVGPKNLNSSKVQGHRLSSRSMQIHDNDRSDDSVTASSGALTNFDSMNLDGAVASVVSQAAPRNDSKPTTAPFQETCAHRRLPTPDSSSDTDSNSATKSHDILAQIEAPGPESGFASKLKRAAGTEIRTLDIQSSPTRSPPSLLPTFGSGLEQSDAKDVRTTGDRAPPPTNSEEHSGWAHEKMDPASLASQSSENKRVETATVQCPQGKAKAKTSLKAKRKRRKGHKSLDDRSSSATRHKRQKHENESKSDHGQARQNPPVATSAVTSVPRCPNSLAEYRRQMLGRHK